VGAQEKLTPHMNGQDSANKKQEKSALIKKRRKKNIEKERSFIERGKVQSTVRTNHAVNWNRQRRGKRTVVRAGESGKVCTTEGATEQGEKGFPTKKERRAW